MGVKNLWDILESCKKTLPLHHLQNKRVCIDLSCWMVQLQNVNKSRCAIKEKVYLRGLFHRLRALIALNCSLIFVADGSVPAIKVSTYRRRLNSGCEVAQDETNAQNLASLRRNMGSEFSCMIREAKILGLALGIPCLDGIEEAEAQCALLNSESLCDGCFTSDSDVFLFGARTVFRDICLGEGGHIVCYEMEDIEERLGFGRNSLITLALLLGSDYSRGVHGCGPESACHIVKSIGDNVVLQQVASEGMSFAKKPKGQRKHAQPNADGSDHISQKGSQFLQVIDAYVNPKCHSADSDAVHRALVQHPFQRTKLQQICDQFFGWPPKKTDEYILPKIAERDLRRFANLRATSSGLGVKLPLDKTPVECPVSEIVKHRKVQGRESFEVLWKELDGLATSIVPADLVESACPEKIVDFEEKRALGKKQNRCKPRRNKSELRSVADIEFKLESLLLDIELGSNTACSLPFPCRALVPGSKTSVVEVDYMKKDLPLDANSEINTYYNPSIPCFRTVSNTDRSEVIDLSSPSPLMHFRTTSRPEQKRSQTVNVIDLSDSEADMSPEHERKARELRLFLASLKDGIP
ncbi:flap endonuclease GEN-like 2 isoform X4 [Tripterygium wilfordii]|uniref:Single-strand DNA endonuclease 1 n=1 Tax=Tripterygium wilfordii TaxID=458696 RepID=A0A7J7DAZ9_TRIWF|nr:single-strand DNA endonuclease 1 [Tripterygium wilfordii]KAF5743545.1 flap endonuclease GEN-like 2 isoform X4 [Tripterygium wilfordii]